MTRQAKKRAFIWGVLPVFVVILGVVFAAQAQRNGQRPPIEALNACIDKKAEGDFCSFRSPHGTVGGQCIRPRGKRQMVCVPQGGRRGPEGQRPPAKTTGLSHGNFSVGGHAVYRGYIPAEPYKQAVVLDNKLTDTGQVTCFDNSGTLDCAKAAKAGFYGQDAHYKSRPQSFVVKNNGTVFDPSTGLSWQKAHNSTRVNWYDAVRTCKDLELGGHDNWRLPSIEELYTITHWQGATGHRHFVAPEFDLQEPDESILQGDKFAATHRTDMMGQTWSSTVYKGDHWDRPGVQAAFFFNFLDGRIKQAPLNGRKGLFYRCVSGKEWGTNDYTDNGNQTITDALTGLTWQQTDSGKALDWQQSLNYCQNLDYGGHDDWRLPNIKELQTLVDYSRTEPAIDPVFTITDKTAWFWSATTFGEDVRDATYVCFGKCTAYDGTDVHGAGAQRSDPKTGTVQKGQYRGGQKDELRIFNYARCVRN